MATVQDVLTRKGSEMVSLAPTDTVLRAAELMNERAIGGIAVVEGGRLVGMFTERDLMRRVVAARRDPAQTLLTEVMTTAVQTCAPETSLEECAAMMTTKRVRHLPVLGPGGIAGMVTIGDVLAFQVGEQQITIQYMHSYIHDIR